MRATVRRPVVAFVLLAYGLSWAVWVPAFLTFSTQGALPFLFLGSFGPAAAATLLTWVGGRSVREWVRGMAVWRVSPRWYAVALGLPVAWAAVNAAVYAGLFGPLDLSLLPERVARWVQVLVVTALVGGGNEEPGWRGFALPHLQRSYSALAASLVVGVVWACWHLPLYVMSSGLYAGRPFGLFLPLAVGLSVLLTWLYNSTGGSVVVPILFHAGVNTASMLIPAPLAAVGDAGWHTWSRLALVALVAISLVAVYGARHLSAGPSRETAPG